MRDLLRILHALVFVGWCGSAWAAGDTLGEAFGEVAFGTWAAFLVLTVFSSIFGLIRSMRRNYEAQWKAANGLPYEQADLTVGPPWNYAIYHLLGSFFVCGLTFLGSEYFGAHPYLEAFLIFAAGYGGMKYADRWTDAVMDGFLNRFLAAFNLTRKDPGT